MKLVRVETFEGEVVWLAPEHIVCIEEMRAGDSACPNSSAVSSVSLVGDHLVDIEGTPDEVAARILEQERGL